MKKGVFILIALLTVSLGAYHVADARPRGGGGMMMGHGCGNCINAGWFAEDDQVDETTQKARETFLSQTTELRKKMVMKQAEMSALMSRENPDDKKAAQFAGELFDLRTQIHQKAIDAGLKPGSGCRMGGGKPGMMMGPMHHGGQGPAGN